VGEEESEIDMTYRRRLPVLGRRYGWINTTGVIVIFDFNF